MAYESGMPMHIAGTAMTWGSVWLLPPAIPLAVYMTLATSNPGMIEAAAGHWKDALDKADTFQHQIETLKKNFDGDKASWDSLDKDHFDNAVNAYMDQFGKVRKTLETVHGIVDKTALALFILCIAVLVIGTLLLAIALLTLGALPIPIVGEAVYSAAQTAALAIMEINIPIFTTIAGFFQALAGFIGVLASFAGGAYGLQFISMGTSSPDFDKVTIEMPKGPLTS